MQELNPLISFFAPLKVVKFKYEHKATVISSFRLDNLISTELLPQSCQNLEITEKINGSYMYPVCTLKTFIDIKHQLLDT